MELKDTAIGIELGSTRIKAVLIGKDHKVLAQGSHTWENSLIDGIWTYSLEEVREGLQSCFRELKEDVFRSYGLVLNTTGALGVSAMMHGYLPFDAEDEQLCAFRTWRNTVTGEAAARLSELFDFNIPQRWSIAHLDQAILDRETHLSKLACITTLAGYIHYILSGKRVMGIGEASGMFPIDPQTLSYNEEMIRKFNELPEVREYGLDLHTLLPQVLTAGEKAGELTEEGALYLDPTGEFRPGVPLAPCEGDAGTGMTATNSVRKRTGNVSAGTSDFAMVVLDKPIRRHREIDIVTTPSGAEVAMVHCNNCTSDINAWVRLFKEVSELFGGETDSTVLYTKLFNKALEGDADCGGLLNYNYYSGEGVTDLDEGRPLFVRRPDASFTLANFLRVQLCSAVATLKIGMDILREEEVPIVRLYGHGGFFKTEGVGQRILSAAVKAPVSVMETAGEGGPYGMALLCAYSLWKEDGETLEDYLEQRVFASCVSKTVMAEEKEAAGFDRFLESYREGLKIEREAVSHFR